MHTPFKQPREIVLVNAFLGDRAKVGGQQRQGDGQQVRFAAQTVTEHPASNQAHQVDLWDQSEVYDERNH